jgi:hypothetical protein
MRYLVLILALASPLAYAGKAVLVGQRTETSVSGRMVNVCTYSYNNQTFEKVFPSGTRCPNTIEVQ